MKKTNNDSFDNRMFSDHSVKLTAAMKKAGSIEGKIPLRINQSTVVYVKPGSDIEFIRQKYERICR